MSTCRASGQVENYVGQVKIILNYLLVLNIMLVPKTQVRSVEKFIIVIQNYILIVRTFDNLGDIFLTKATFRKYLKETCLIQHWLDLQT